MGDWNTGCIKQAIAALGQQGATNTLPPDALLLFYRYAA